MRVSSFARSQAAGTCKAREPSDRRRAKIGNAARVVAMPRRRKPTDSLLTHDGQDTGALFDAWRLLSVAEIVEAHSGAWSNSLVAFGP